MIPPDGSALIRHSSAEIGRRPFLDAVCKEVLRFCPDIPFAVRKTSVRRRPGRLEAARRRRRSASASTSRTAGAVELPGPRSFWPDRFLSARPSRFEYLPFGGGRRGCVAGPLYLFVQKLILAAAFERFRLRLCDRRDNPVTLDGDRLQSSPGRSGSSPSGRDRLPAVALISPLPPERTAPC